MIKLCLCCGKDILPGSPQFKAQKYCSDACRKSYFKKSKSRQRRIDQRRSNLPLNLEFIKLVNECYRGGTIQILSGHDFQSLALTMELIRNRPKFDVNLCHIYPVKGNGRTGLFHYRNLFYGGAHQNKVLGNSYFGAGLSIANSERAQKWEVTDGMPMREVLCKIEEYLGPILDQYLENISVRRSPKATLAQRIVEIAPELAIEKLILKSYRDLSLIWKSKTKLSAFFVTARRLESKYVCYLDELSRFVSYDVVGSKYLTVIRRFLFIGYVCLSKVEESETFNKVAADKYSVYLRSYSRFHLRRKESWSEFKDLMYEIAFYALQGMTMNLVALTLIVSGYISFGENAYLN